MNGGERDQAELISWLPETGFIAASANHDL